MLVASPRNHHNLQREVARFWRPLRILGGTQHRRQIPLQLDLQLALVRRQDDGVDEATQRLRGFRAGFWIFRDFVAGVSPKQIAKNLNARRRDRGGRG